MTREGNRHESIVNQRGRTRIKKIAQSLRLKDREIDR